AQPLPSHALPLGVVACACSWPGDECLRYRPLDRDCKRDATPRSDGVSTDRVERPLDQAPATSRTHLGRIFDVRLIMGPVPVDPSTPSLAGRNAVVTGAAQGIGAAIACAFAAYGADVAVCDRNENGLATTAG